MTSIQRLIPHASRWIPALMVLALAACGGSRDPVLGVPPVTTGPTLISSVPADTDPAQTDVLTNSQVSVTFSEAMRSASITTASFSLACPVGAPVASAVAYNDETRVATLTPTLALPADTDCVATVTTAVQNAAGIAMTSPYVWEFRTAPTLAADTTRPTVSLTAPAGGDLGVATNGAVSVTFSEAMSPATLTAATFTLTDTTLGAPVAGTVSYAAASRTASFTPAAPDLLAADRAYTATLTTAVTDLAGNALAGNTAVLPAAGAQVWSFTTGSAADATAPLVTAISPADGSLGNCPASAVSATFGEPMDAATIDGARFTVTQAGIAVVGTVSYDAPTRVASFIPAAAEGFAADQAFVATVVSGIAGVKDLAGNPLAADRSWAFSTGAQACLSPVTLGAAASFGAFGGAAGVTSQGVQTVIGGNLGTTAACTLVTGLHDAAHVYTETPLNMGVVNGSIQCGPPAPGTNASLSIATRALDDARTAYNALAALPPGSDPAAGELGGLVLTPGVYTAAGGSFGITSGDLVLDAQGNPNAVWVFQSASALTVGLSATPREVRLVNGARAGNVFWQVGSAARIEDGSTLVGTVIAPAGVSFSTPGQTLPTRLVGRAIGLTASVTLVNTIIVAP